MSTQPDQGKNADQDSYSGYAGYRPRKPADDPYGAYYQPGGTAGQAGTTGTGQQQSDPNYVYGQKQQQSQQYASSGQQQQQQSRAYVPPSSVTGRSYGSSSGQTKKRLQPNQAAALSYLGLCFTGVFFFFWGRQNRLVRFSSAQSIVLFFPLLVVYYILKAIFGFIALLPLLGPIIAGFLGTALFFLIVVPGFILWLFLMVQAYRGVEQKLPFVGEYAEKLVNLFSPRQKKQSH